LLQSSVSVAMLALDMIKQGKTTHYHQLESIYIRKPQAEREYDDNNRAL